MAHQPIDSAFLVVVSRDHAIAARDGGFVQVGHGRPHPLRQLGHGSGVAIYSAKTTFGGSEACQCFTAIGRVVDDEPYQTEVVPGFNPFRRDVKYWRAKEVEIRPLLDELELTRDKPHWGAPLRYGFLEIDPLDFRRIAVAMGVRAKL